MGTKRKWSAYLPNGPLQKWQWGRTFRRLLRISYLNGGQQKDQREMGNRDRAATLSLPASVGPLKREAVASQQRKERDR